MPKGLVAICQFGGEFVKNNDGSMSYCGGDAHAIPVDQSMTFDEFKSELVENLNCDMNTVSIKYFLPTNKKVPITINSDLALQRMVGFHEDSDNIDVFVIAGETASPSTSKKVDQRSKRNENRSVSRATKMPLIAACGVSTGSRNKPAEIDLVTSLAPVTPAFNDVGQVRPATNATVDNVDQTRRSIPFDNAMQLGHTVTTNGVEQPVLDITMADVVQPINTFVGDQARIVAATNTNLVHQVDATAINNMGLIVPVNSDIILGVGQEYSNARDFREVLRKYAITKGFVLQYVKNENARVTAKCKANGCPWRVHASRLPKMHKFRLRKINDMHTCSGNVGKEGHPQATNHWIASIVKEKLRENPLLKPREIADDIARDYGISLKYHKVWRGKEMAMEQIQASRANAYNQLPWFCDRIRETNPGSVVTLATKDDSRFHRLFFSFHASKNGFQNGCRPLLFLNGISLKDKYLGTLLTASALDGEDGIFPVAFAMVEAESYDNWHWFLVELKAALSTTHVITFVSDKNNGLEAAVPQVFEDSYHGFCLTRLLEDFKKQLTGLFTQPVKDAMVEEFKRAAYAYTASDFNECIGTMRNVSHDIAAWVLGSKYENWSNAFFRGARYNYYSSSVVEAFFNSWIPDEHDLSIIQMMDMIRCKMMELIYTRREAARAWSTTLTPSPEEKLQIEIFNSRALNVLISSDTVFEVRDDSVNIVNIETWDCTCRQWKVLGLPCIHAVAVLDRTGRNIYEYCSRYFTVDSYRCTYSESINPIPDIEKPVQNPVETVNPPIRRIRRPPGRPKQKRNDLDVMRKKLRPLHCSRCKGAGHNKKTCSEFD